MGQPGTHRYPDTYMDTQKRRYPGTWHAESLNCLMMPSFEADTQQTAFYDGHGLGLGLLQHTGLIKIYALLPGP